MSLSPRGLRARRLDPLQTYRPVGLLAQALQDPAEHMLIRAPNRIGKTTMLARLFVGEAVAKPGYRGRLTGPTRSQTRDVIQRHVAHFASRHLDARSSYNEGTGFNRNVTALFANGSAIEFRSCEAPVQSHEGGEFDRCGFDEVPKLSHLRANIGRSGPTRAGRVIIATTIVNISPDRRVMLRQLVEGPTERPETGPGRHVMPTGWVQYVPAFTRENVPWLTATQYQAQRAKWEGTPEEEQRLSGAWEGASALRALSFFGPRHVIPSVVDHEMHDWPLYVLGFDHGKAMGKQVCHLIGVDPVGLEFYVMREWVGAGSDSPDVDARGVLDMLAEVNVSPYNIHLARGDIGDGIESVKGVAAQSRNRWIETQIASLLGVQRCPFRIEVPYKAPGLWRIGEIAMNHAFKWGKMSVYEGCQHFRRSALTYQGSTTHADRNRKDGLDPVRYALQDWLIEQRGGESVPMFVH